MKDYEVAQIGMLICVAMLGIGTAMYFRLRKKVSHRPTVRYNTKKNRWYPKVNGKYIRETDHEFFLVKHPIDVLHAETFEEAMVLMGHFYQYAFQHTEK